MNGDSLRYSLNSPSVALRRRLAGLLVFMTLAVIHAASAWPQSTVQVLHQHVVPLVKQGKVGAIGQLSPAQHLTFSMHMPVRNVDALVALIQRQSDRRSSDYRRWLSVAQFTDQFGRTDQDYQKVLRFAQDHGFRIVSESPNKLIVTLQGTVDQVEKAFQLNLKTYPHPTENRTFFSPDREPSVAIDVPISHISGLNNYQLPRPLLKRPASAASGYAPTSTGSGPNGYWLGNDIRTAYDMGPNTGTGQTVALLEYSGYAASDIATFFNNIHQVNTVPIINIPVIGGTPNSWTNDDDETEAALDIEWVLAVAPGLSQLRVYVAPEGLLVAGEFAQVDGPLLSQIATDNSAKVVSSSWTWWPDDPATDEPYFQEMAVQGQTYLQASGDAGAYISGNDEFDASYPPEDPYVTSVGGTTLTTSGPGGAWLSEVVWNDGYGGSQILYAGSGGGPANDGPQSFPIPSWQAPVINAANAGSTIVRNVPDVALEADLDSYFCSVEGCGGVGGTSVATPRWAAYLALVNQQLAATQASTGLGLLAPAIYAIGQGPASTAAFHDIVVGNNNVFGQAIFFNAAPGYDLTTGWGSMDGQGLSAALIGPSPVSTFALSTLTSGVTIAQGAAGSTTVLISSIGGFNGEVSLSVSGLPAGVTASFSSNTAMSSSVLTLNASVIAPLVPTTFTIIGTSGGISVNIPFALNIVSPAGFTVSSSVPSMNLIQGTSVYSSVLINRAIGFDNEVFITVTGLPAGVTALLYPNDPQSNTESLNLTASSTAATGTFTVTINGFTQGAAVPTSSTTVSLSVYAEPTLTITASPPLVTLKRGSTATATLTVVASNPTVSSVSIGQTTLPEGVTASVVPSQVNLVGGTASAVVTLAANSSAKYGTAVANFAAGSYIPYVTANVNLQVKIGAPAPAFLLMTSPSLLVVPRGSSASTAINISALDGFDGSVKLALLGLPAGATAVFSSNPTSSSSTLTVTAAANATVGRKSLTLTGTSGKETARTYLTLGISAQPQN